MIETGFTKINISVNILGHPDILVYINLKLHLIYIILG